MNGINDRRADGVDRRRLVERSSSFGPFHKTDRGAHARTKIVVDHNGGNLGKWQSRRTSDLITRKRLNEEKTATRIGGFLP